MIAEMRFTPKKSKKQQNKYKYIIRVNLANINKIENITEKQS